MRVIGVIDLKAGKAVHARGGRREMYEPVRSALLPAEQVGDAIALARAYGNVPGLTEIYVADLDRIEHGGPLSETFAPLLAASVPIMADVGASSIDDAAAVLDAGAARVVIGLETLPSFRALERIIGAVGASHVVFSLDLRGARAVARTEAALTRLAPIELAAHAVQSGANAVLLLDLARVGQAAGPDLALLREARSAFPEIELLVGGGIRGANDLGLVAAAGGDGALVGTALHDGSLPAGIRHAATGREAPGR